MYGRAKYMIWRLGKRCTLNLERCTVLPFPHLGRIKRRRDHTRPGQLPPDVDQQLRANPRICGGHVSETDGLIQGRGHGSARHLPHDPPIGLDPVVRTGDASVDQLEPDQLPSHSLRSLFAQGVTADEISLLQFDDPGEARLEWGGLG